MNAGLLAGINQIPVVGQIATGLINSATAKRNTDKANQANRELAEYSYQKDVEMWNRMNEYNLPTSQMKRLKDAGLNPNLIYGSGGAGTVAAQMPKYNAPTMSYNYKPMIDPMAMIGAYQDVQIRNAQIDNLKAQAKVQEQEVYNRRLGADILSQKRDQYWNTWQPKLQQEYERLWGMEQSRKQSGEIFKYQLESMKSNTNKMDLSSDLMRKQIDWYTGNAIMNIIGKAAGAIKLWK